MAAEFLVLAEKVKGKYVISSTSFVNFYSLHASAVLKSKILSNPPCAVSQKVVRFFNPVD
jgi:hypothetical protein